MTFLGAVAPPGDPASRICYPRFRYLQSGKIGEAVRIHHLGPARGGEDVDRTASSFCLAEVRMIETLEHLPTLWGHLMGQSGSFGQARRAARCGTPGVPDGGQAPPKSSLGSR